MKAADDGAPAPDAQQILDDCVSLIGADVAKLQDIVRGDDGKPTRVLTGEEARILAGYARALVDVARARKAAADDPLTPEEQAAIAELEKHPQFAEMLKRAGVRR